MRKSDKLALHDSSTTPSQMSGSAASSSALLAVAILLFVVTRCYIALVLDPQITDIGLYRDYATKTVDQGATPYRDFEVEYPPVSFWSIYLPRLLEGHRLTQDPHSATNWLISRAYHRVYRLEMAFCDLVSFGLFLAIVRRRRPQLAGLAAMVYVVTSTILCHVLYDHLDEGVLLLSMLGAYAWMRTLESEQPSLLWSWAALFFFGLGFSHKLLPLVAAPFLLLGLWRSPDRCKQIAAGLLGLIMGAAGPFAVQYAISGPGVFDLFTHHAGRGIQVESLYSTLMWIGSLFGGSISISLSSADKSGCVFGDGASAMQTLSTVLLCGFLGGTWICAALRGSRFGRAEALGLAAFALGGCAIFLRVLSPQFFVWVIPMLLLAGIEVVPERGRRCWTLAALLVVLAGLTTWLFPYHYFCAPLGREATPTSCGLIPASPESPLAPSCLAYVVLAVRNVLCLAVVAWIGAMLYRRAGAAKAKEGNGDDAQPLPAMLRQIMPSCGSTWAGVALLVVTTAVVYLPAISGGELLDDDLLLTKSKIVKASDGLLQIWFTAKAPDYWPLTNSTFWIEWRLWGNDLTGYHITNLVLHILESLLIWGLLQKLGVPGAFWGATLFAVHPVNVESVAWIASRKNVVALLFFLLSVWWYLKAEEQSSAAGGSLTRKTLAKTASLWDRATDFSVDEFSGVWYWLSLAAFVLAMFGKGSVAVMPALLLCIVWWKRPLEWRDARRMLPFLAAGAALAWLNLWFQTHDTEKVIRNVDFAQRVLGAAGAIWFYLYKAVWPFNLALIYPEWKINAGSWLWWMPLCGLGLATAALFLAAKPWRAARNSVCPFWFAWLFFAAALFPVIGLCDVGFMKYALVADRYLHIALLAIVALAAAGIGTVRAKSARNTRWLVLVSAAAVVTVLAVVSWRQSALYIDRFTLFQAAKEKNPDCWMIHQTLGTWELNHNRPEESIPYFRKALELCPAESPDRGRIHAHYGRALFKLGRKQEGIEQWESALAAGCATPEITDALGKKYREARDIDKLMSYYSRLTELYPDNSAFHDNFGMTLAQVGRLPEAIKQYRRAIELDPQNAEALNNLGVACYCRGDISQAVDCYQRALLCKPDYAEAHYNLAGVFYRTDAIPDAITHLEAAVRVRPDHGSAFFLLAKCYRLAHEDGKAVAAGEKALELARSTKQDRVAAEIEKWLKSSGGE
jgi:protein O-mannosyl-transferase